MRSRQRLSVVVLLVLGVAVTGTVAAQGWDEASKCGRMDNGPQTHQDPQPTPDSLAPRPYASGPNATEDYEGVQNDAVYVEREDATDSGESWTRYEAGTWDNQAYASVTLDDGSIVQLCAGSGDTLIVGPEVQDD